MHQYTVCASFNHSLEPMNDRLDHAVKHCVEIHGLQADYGAKRTLSFGGLEVSNPLSSVIVTSLNVFLYLGSLSDAVPQDDIQAGPPA
jgi:hypothetical protein